MNVTSELLGFSTLSIVWYSKKTREHNVSEPGSDSILAGGEGGKHAVGSFRKQFRVLGFIHRQNLHEHNLLWRLRMSEQSFVYNYKFLWIRITYNK
jgi:hypothetical protein